MCLKSITSRMIRLSAGFLDKTSKQLIAETRLPIPAKPGIPALPDYEYARNGTANLFMLFAPLEGWRHVKVTDRRATIDYAQLLKELSDTHFPEAQKIRLVQDNLTLTSQPHSTRLSPLPRRVGWSNGLSGITPRNMGVG